VFAHDSFFFELIVVSRILAVNFAAVLHSTYFVRYLCYCINFM